MWSWKAGLENKYRGLLVVGGGGREERSEVLRDEGQICSFFQVNVSEVCEAICFYNLSAKLFLL